MVLFFAFLFAAQPQPDAAHVLAFLNRTIAWYDRLDGEARLADQPTDVLYVNDNRQLAHQVVTLSFEFAKADAQFISSAPAPPQPPTNNRSQRMAQRAASTAEQLKREQDRLAALMQQTPRNDAAIAEAQSRVAMAQARNDAVSAIVAFSGTSGSASDLMSQIGALEQTVPATAGTPATAQHATNPTSVIGLIGDVVRLNQKAGALRTNIRAAEVLQADARTFSTPLVQLMSQMRKSADALMNQPDTNDSAELARRKTELDALNVRFRQVSAAMLPLAKSRIVLEAYKANLTRWSASVVDQDHDDLRRLLIRGIALAVMVLLVVAISVVWRRVTFRYVHDAKRRHHFLLIRRIVVLLLVAAILIATFASDFSSLTTFIGLITAGIAIAMQDVILSVAGYFVIVGKYGIRAGDRVRIASVNGDILDVGLVWIYLMELETRGSDQLPTGRIVEFPNSVVFDHSAGIFKQLPGTRFLWHELSYVVPPDRDFHDVQARMLAAVNGVFDEYRESIERQHREMERLLSMPSATPAPHSRLRVAPSGVEIRVRYPVEIEHAGDVDDRVAAAVTKAVQG